MRMQQFRPAILAGIIGCVFTVAAPGQVAVWTQHNSNTRIGNNNSETVLTPANVNRNTFGKLFTYTLDDQTYSQPLYIPGLKMAVDGQVHNVVFVTTVNNTVYAWDADSNTANGGKPLWVRNLTPPETRVPDAKFIRGLGSCGFDYKDFAGNLGMVGTPVIDTSTSTLYVVAHVLEGRYQDQAVQRLHALDITSGQDKFGGPRIIETKEKDAFRGFNPQTNNQRPALALVNGVVYIGWASYCDMEPYHGWIIGYKASDLSQVTVWSPTPFPGEKGGFWQSGQGVMADGANNLYLLTGNGTADNGINNYGMSAVRLTPDASGALAVSSFFTPCNYANLNGDDLDIGSAGVIPIPGTELVAGGGKEGMFYLMQSDSLGGNGRVCPDDIIQEFQAVFPHPSTAEGHLHGSPVYYNTGTAEYVYLWGENDFLRGYQFFRQSPQSPAHFNSTAAAASTMQAPQIPPPPPPHSKERQGGMPGGFLSISSNGTVNGIVWALTLYGCNANHDVEPGILYAFDASNFTGSGPTRQLTDLWDSKQLASRDDVGYFAKFTYPTIANGKVYVAGWGPVPPGEFKKCSPVTGVPTNRGQLSVYGLIR